jgi:quinohemoprotein amine dehydrogenase
MRQVLAVSEDGARLAGRQFLRDSDSLGGALTGVRADRGPAILGAAPSTLATGNAQIQFVGAGLGGLSLDGLAAEGFAENAYGASAQVAANGNAAVTLVAGETSAVLATYATVDRIAIEPAFSIARVGGGSPVGPDVVPAHFKAIGFWNGADGQPGTDDDVRIGAVPATWSVSNHGESAEAMEDAKFAGAMDAATGIFMPAIAGPNPDRPFSTNNAGDLMVTAEAAGQTAEAQLIVTVQRFIDPPIR